MVPTIDGSPAAPPGAPVDAVDWADREPGLPEAVREVQRVLRRASARPVLTLAATVVVTALLIGMVARKVPLQRARVILRVQENAFAGDLALAQKGELKNHIYQVVLSRDRLLEVIHRHNLYPSAQARGDDEAVEQFREALDVQEFRNYFLVGHGEDNQLASGRIAISFTDPDYQVASAVVEDLAQVVIEAEHERRKAAVDAAVAVARRALDLANTQLEERQADLASKQYLLEDAKGAEKAQLQVDVLRLERSIPTYRAMVEEARAQLEQVNLAVGAEDRRLGVSVEVAQFILPPPPPRSKLRLLVVVGLLGFLSILPLCAIAIGAFDSRVYDLEDVERIGLVGIGHVPRFAGANDGSLDQRIGRPSWWRRGRSRR